MQTALFQEMVTQPPELGLKVIIRSKSNYSNHDSEIDTNVKRTTALELSDHTRCVHQSWGSDCKKV